MYDPLQTALVVGSLAVALVALGYVVLGRPVDMLLLGALAALEVGLLAQLVVGLAQVTTGDHQVAALTFVGYLVGVLLVLPAGALWSLGERSRSGTAVLVVATLVVPVLVLRLEQIWSASG